MIYECKKVQQTDVQVMWVSLAKFYALSFRPVETACHLNQGVTLYQFQQGLGKRGVPVKEEERHFFIHT
jgi:hypothetical protein